jgi:hypothetical protein
MTRGDWSRASWSKSNGSGDCVEVAIVGETIGLRDSKDPTGPVLTCTYRSWREFLRIIRQDAPSAIEQ